MKLITRSFYILIMLIIQHVNAQDLKIDTADYPKRSSFLTGYREKSKSFNKDIGKKYSGSESKQLSRVFTGFQKSLEEDIRDRNYFFDNRFINFVTERIRTIAAKNPDIPTDFHILIAKDNEPNAFNFGDRTLVVNLGLFVFLDNDDQFTSIICHEIAHAKLEHTINSILSKIKKDNQNKGQVSSIKHSDNQYDKAFELYRSVLYSNMKERRNNEIKADSLGFEYYKNLGLQRNSYVSALQKLKSVDDKKPDSISAGIYRKIFEIPGQPFKDEWLKMEDFSNYNYKLYTKKISEDSLKTHPDVDLRIRLLKNKLFENGSVQNVTDLNSPFAELQKMAKNRVLPNYYDTEKYGLGIYQCLILLHSNPDDKLARFYLGKFFSRIYEARKSYTLNRYLESIDPQKQTYSYRQFLSFMWNLNLDEIKSISAFYEKSES